ncbi:MAG TPA: TetR family transcriptional regulator [Sporichthyaceae bacterium]|nr:TetR family transcriptional regulator [Sporichthyaceae bacterium]
MTFQRARSDEQREVRRRVILDTAAAMLREMPAAELSLNELSRRVGLAKSNVLRYFESREAVLLELLEHEIHGWVDDVAAELAAEDRRGPVAERADRLAAVLATTLQHRPVLCDLVAAQPAVLEHNTSVETVLRFKRSTRDHLAAVTTSARQLLPELGPTAGQLCLMSVVIAGALSAQSQCSPSALAAYEIEPELAALRLDLPAALEDTIKTLTAGILARSRAHHPTSAACRTH